MDYELQEEHRADCKAVEYVKDDTWDSPWTFAQSERCQYDEQKEAWKSNVALQYKKSQMYVALKCSDTECPASLLVKADDLLQYRLPTGETEDE